MLSTAVRASLVVALGCTCVGALPPTAARAGTLEAWLVASHSTASDAWGVPSTDPSGIAYDSVNRRLVIADGEVEETPLYAGANLFLSTLDGLQDPARIGGTSLPWSKEPVGAAFRASDSHLFVSDDDADRVSEVAPGADGVHGTADDAVTSFSTRGIVGSEATDNNGDAEDVAVDPGATSGGHLFVIDGTSAEVYEYGPGPDGRFDGIGDTVSSFDMKRHGALDPEGIEFHPGRNTLFVLDAMSQKIYEVDRQGALINAISIASAKAVKAAGMTFAPASNGSGAQNIYIVARGVDNDTDPSENDGRFYEMAVDLPPLPVAPPNVAPTANAGPDVLVTRPAAAALSGSVTDDGLPTPPGAVTAAWTKLSGPGDVVFADASSGSTTAKFSAPGDYVLRLTADDGALVHWDDVAVVVREADGSGVLDVPIRTGADDAEERSDRTILTGADLEMIQDGTAVQKVGLRFAGVALPQAAVIRKAYVQFATDEPQTAPASLTIAGHATDDAPVFTTASKDVSGRTRTAAAVAWSPAGWPTVGARGVDQQTPDLAAVLQEIVDRPGWAQGNALSLIVTGTGTRTASAYERGVAKAPVLHIEYGPAPGTEPVNAAPVADAGPDVALTLPAGATLTGSLSDDGLPVGAPVTAAWTTVSGPGAVTFATPTASSTGVTFGIAGTYVLRLTGSDGQLTGSDDVTVTVLPGNAAPVANAGPDLALTLPAGATLTGTVSDDGLPVGAPVTTAWTTVSGPGAVTFATPTASSTGVTFGIAGTYVLRLTGSDGQLTGSDDVTVTVSPAPVPSGVLDVRVKATGDDAEERSDGRVRTKSGDLTLGRDGSRAQTVGLRFAGIDVPAGARITKAYVQFQADETNAQASRLTIVGQAADNPARFTSVKRNISARPTTAVRVAWVPAGWSAGMRSTAQRTPDLTSVVQEIVSRPGWAKGNALVLVVAGDGTRVAEAVEAGAAKAPVLHIEFGPAPAGG
ncbi:MAG: hypothetical protein M3Q22_09595 [Actinomycetota bacterium]|nr:hypothetical protein [Actinomycetota bacterium]